jgi:hypothetical protein
MTPGRGVPHTKPSAIVHHEKRERVRLDTETVTDERQISEEVRKEQIQVDDDKDQLGRHDER